MRVSLYFVAAPRWSSLGLLDEGSPVVCSTVKVANKNKKKPYFGLVLAGFAAMNNTVTVFGMLLFRSLKWNIVDMQIISFKYLRQFFF